MTNIPMDQDSIFQDSRTVNQLNELRELAESSPQLAQDKAWQWIAQLGKTDNQIALATLFAQGSVENPCTRTLGMPVGPMRNVPGGAAVSAYLKVDSPWTGKTFHQDGTGGFNRIKSYTKIPVSILAPFHRLTRQSNEYVGFKFDTTTKEGAVEPKVNVISIEYAKPSYKNPSKIIPIKNIRDELVKVLPHTYLGRATYPDKNGSYQLVGYFALKRPVTTEL